jgi:hypothetical protein
VAISSLAAVGQAGAVAVLMPAVRQHRSVLAGMIAAAGIGTAVVDAALWVVLGSSAGAAGYAWQLVLAVVFAVAAMVLCRSGIDSIWTASGYDLPRFTRVMRWIGGVLLAAAAAGGAAVLVMEQPSVDRLLRLIAIAGLASAVIATVVVVGVALERVRTKRKARVAELYRRISSDGSSNDR